MKITRACNKEKQKNVPACITCMSTTDSILFTLAERSMAHVMLHFIQHCRALRRERLLRDRLNPLEKYDDVEIKALFRFERHNILQITNDLRLVIEHTTGCNKALSPLHQVCVFLRFAATGCMQTSKNYFSTRVSIFVRGCFSAVLYGKMICKML